MSFAESIKEASTSASFDSPKISSSPKILDTNALAQSIFKLETNLSKEIKENLAEASGKMMKEFGAVEKNFEEMFYRMDQQEEAAEKLRLKFAQYETHFEKFERDQENLKKRINSLMASVSPKTHAFVPPIHHNLNSRARAPFNANMVRPQQQQTQHQHSSNRRFMSNFAKNDIPEEKPQFSSNDQKSWTLRGEGMFTESDSSSEDEYAGKLASESPVSAKLTDYCVSTPLDSVSKNSFNSGDVVSDTKSQESKKLVQEDEGTTKKVEDVLANAFRSMQKPRIKDWPVVDVSKIEEVEEIAGENICLSEPIEQEKEPDISCAVIAKEEISLSMLSGKRESLCSLSSSPTICPDVAEALAKMTSVSTSAKKTTSGGFGSFRKGKVTNATPVIQKSTVEIAKDHVVTPIGACENSVGKIVSRRLTPDEMGVLNKVFQKKDSPRLGTFFGKGSGAMIPPGNFDQGTQAQFPSNQSFSSPRNPKGVGASFGNNWRKQQPAKKFGL